LPSTLPGIRNIRNKVNLKGVRRVWRLIALRGDQTLDDLHEAIFLAFDRYDEHLYSFYFPKAATRRDRLAPRPREYTSPRMLEEDDSFEPEKRFDAGQARLDDLRLKVGQTFEYLFDFGDSWWHEVKVEAIGPVNTKTRFPMILERRGDSPPQYEPTEE
jgi:hypothetical protein